MTVAAILLAGGESTRMGVPKPLLEWGGYRLIEYQLAQLKGPPVDRVVVVLGHGADDVLPFVRSADAHAVVNEPYGQRRAPPPPEPPVAPPHPHRRPPPAARRHRAPRRRPPPLRQPHHNPHLPGEAWPPAGSGRLAAAGAAGGERG